MFRRAGRAVSFAMLVARIAVAVAIAASCDDQGAAATSASPVLPPPVAPPATGQPVTNTAGGTPASRCDVLAPAYPPTRDTGNAEALLPSPTGLLVLATAGWWTERGTGPLDFPVTGHSAALTSTGVLWIAQRSLARAGRDMSSPTTLRALGDRACEPQLLATPSGALLLYRSVSAGTCDEPRGPSRAMIQRLGPDGEVLAPPVALGGDDPSRRPSSGISARHDAGRIVVSMDDDEDRPTALVLDGNGNELGFVDGPTLDGGELACVRSGCLRVATAANATGRGGAGFVRLGVRDLASQVFFDLDAPEGQLNALAVRGDRILFRVWENAGERNHAIGVIDVAHRRLELLHDAESGQRMLHVALRGTYVGAIAVTAHGFVIAGVDPTAGAYTREVRCVD